jgi:hypothetical protein
MAAVHVDQVDKCGLDHGALVGNETLLVAHRGGRDRLAEPVLQRRDAFVLVYAARGAVAGRHHAANSNIVTIAN